MAVQSRPRGPRLCAWFGKQWIGEVALVPGRPLRIGRSSQCDVCLPDPLVSREHAEVRPVAGGWEIVDLGSTAGTLCKGVSIGRQRLRSGDQFVLGDSLVLAVDLAEAPISKLRSRSRLVAIGAIVAVAVVGAAWFFGSRGGHGEGVGPAGGTIERDGARLEIPAGALAREQRIALSPASDVPALTYEAAGPAFALDAGQAWFAKPLVVTLPIDRARLPAGAVPEQVYAVLAQNGLGEKLDGAKVDLAAGTVTVALDHSTPLVAAQGSPGPSTPPVLQAAFGPAMGVVLVTSQAVYTAPTGLPDAAAIVELVRPALQVVLAQYRDIEIEPGTLQVEIRPMAERVLAYASGRYQIFVNPTSFEGADPRARAGTLIHEFFHLVQHRYLVRNAIRHPGLVPRDYRVRGQADWLWEATATWMDTHLSPTGGRRSLPYLARNFSYLPLHQFDTVSVAQGAENPDLPHQYAAFIFFSYLDTLYTGRQVVLAVWSDYLSGNWVEDTVENDALRGQGTFNPLVVLDHYLRATPDRLGRRRTLREVYAEFLLHLNWLKDFQPIAGETDTYELGPARELILPGGVVSWALPFVDGDRLGRLRSDEVSGGGFQIARAYHVTNQLDAKAGQRADLEVRLGIQAGAPPEESMLVVFPYKDGIRSPVVGNSRNPILLENWQDHIGAVVWAVDLSLRGNWPLTTTAELKPRKQEDPDTTGGTLGPQVCTFRERLETRWEEMESGTWKVTPKPTAIELTNAESGRTVAVSFTRPPETLSVGQEVPFEVTCTAAGGYSEQGAIGNLWQTTQAFGDVEFVNFSGGPVSCQADSNTLSRRSNVVASFGGPSPGDPPGRRELVKLRVKAVVGSNYYYLFLGWWYECG